MRRAYPQTRVSALPARPAGATYLDKPSGGAAIVEAAAAVSLAGEVDRIYTNTP